MAYASPAHTRQEYLVCRHLEKIDDFNRRFFQPQIEGSKTALELPGIVDQVITMTEMTNPEGKSFRAFICHTINDAGYLAKDRSGRLDLMEEPHLGRLMQKIAGKAKPAAERLTFSIEQDTPASSTPDSQQNFDTQGGQ